jgi:DNA (cytosine-5)-methyltransferase 1
VFLVGFKQQPINFEFPKKSDNEPSLSRLLETDKDAKRLSLQSQGYVKHYLEKHPLCESIKDLDCLIAYEIRKSRTNFRFDDLSPCLTTKMGTGGNNVPYLVNQARFLSLRECLKIQGFPANFKLTKSYSHALRQIGNSVAVPVVRAVVKNAVEACSR